jgi:predicted dehydrogenase
MTKIKVGIIGVGQIGKHHIAAYKKIEGAEITAVADINADEAKRVAETNAIPNWHSDFREMLKRGDIEAVDVCVHNNLHMPLVIEALKAGKHVYCEKPMAGAYRDAKTMMEAAKKAKKKLGIQLSTLFAAETKAAAILINEGCLGRIYHARSTGFRRRGRPYVDGYGAPFFVQKKFAGGGALYDMGVYHIATVMYLIKNPGVMTVSGNTFQETAIDEARRKKSNYDVEELATAYVRLNGGISLDIIEAWAIHLNSLDGAVIVGNKGGLRLNPFGFYKSEGDLDMDTTINMDNAKARWRSVRGAGDAYDGPQNHWIAALQGRVPLLPTAEIALNTMLISEGIYLSQKLGREVTAPEIEKNSKSSALKI